MEVNDEMEDVMLDMEKFVWMSHTRSQRRNNRGKCHYSEESVHRVYGKAIVVIAVVIFFFIRLISSLLNCLVWSHPLFQSTSKLVYTKKESKI